MVKIQFGNAKDEELALPLILLHSPSKIFRNRVYIISHESAQQAKEADIKFTEISEK